MKSYASNPGMLKFSKKKFKEMGINFIKWLKERKSCVE